MILYTCIYIYIYISDVRYVSIYRNFHSISRYNIGFWVYRYTGVGSLVNMFFPICLILYIKQLYKLVCITLIDLFYHFLTTTTIQDIYLHFIGISIIISNIAILYRIMIFLAAIRNNII